MNILNKNLFNTINAFTLAEVLITLLIIGVVSSIVIPNLINDMQNEEYKVAYKKAYTDANSAVHDMISNYEYKARTGEYDWNNTMYNWNIFKQKFSVQKDCSSSNRFDCWEKNGDCAEGMFDENGDFVDAGACTRSTTPSFIDTSGRSWTLYSSNETPIMVDINGFKSPNKLGRDRFAFTYANANNTRAITGIPVKLLPNGNDTSADRWCHQERCYYSSWLFGVNGALKY